MATTKTTYTGQDVRDFINSYVDNEQKKADSFRLIELLQEWSETLNQKCGAQALSVLVTIITNMQPDTKEMHQFLAFHQEKQHLRFMYILIPRKVICYYLTLVNLK
jgi:hypothetical protein